jgi:hypothetical protein
LCFIYSGDVDDDDNDDDDDDDDVDHDYNTTLIYVDENDDKNYDDNDNSFNTYQQVEKVFSSLLMNYLDPDYFYVATGTIDGDDIGAVECR